MYRYLSLLSDITMDAQSCLWRRGTRQKEKEKQSREGATFLLMRLQGRGPLG